ncbi:MAG: hypothetical protein KDL87_15270 [Verrucomicrobiae bacterium]|nr:hypothetical protein [Verrucomicrobiae bacterium]
MKIFEFLAQNPEPMPEWLADFQEDKPFQIEEFFGSRVVFYPGSGTDGHPVKIFGSTHSAHAFVYAENGHSQAEIEAELQRPTRRFRGYHPLYRIMLDRASLGLGEMVQVDGPDPYQMLVILERDKDLSADHGALRIAILFLGADGIGAYASLFGARQSSGAPFAVLLQDHGWGGNYDKFGHGGRLEEAARGTGALPDWLLVAEGTHPWDGYSEVPDVEGEPGGMHGSLRKLFQRTD